MRIGSQIVVFTIYPRLSSPSLETLATCRTGCLPTLIIASWIHHANKGNRWSLFLNRSSMHQSADQGQCMSKGGRGRKR